MATRKLALEPVNAQSRLMGFGNLFRKENGEWWRTRTWLVHSIIWLLLINGTLLAVLSTPPSATPDGQPPPGTDIFVIMGGLMTGLGIIIVMQGAILDEKKSGTAAWVLSKPLSRSAFILAKLVANALAALVVMIVLQGVVAYILLSVLGQLPPPTLPNFLAALGLLALHLLFYLTLTLMLGTLFNERGAVIGIPIGLLFGAQLLMGLSPALAQIMPWAIVMPVGAESTTLANQVMAGQALSTVTPIIATVVWIVFFTAVALWRFKREEF